MARELSARYEAAAPGWGRRLAYLGFPAAYRAIVAEVQARLPLPALGAIDALDLGSGDGAFAQAMLDQIGWRLRLTLLDSSPAMLRAAEARLGAGRVRLIEGTLNDSPLALASHDIVSAAHLLEHLPDPDRALARMGRLLRPGGLVILAVSRPHWCSRLVWLTWRHRRFSEGEMRQLLRQAGFTGVICWQLPKGPPRRLSLAYAARWTGQAECAPPARLATKARTSAGD